MHAKRFVHDSSEEWLSVNDTLDAHLFSRRKIGADLVSKAFAVLWILRQESLSNSKVGCRRFTACHDECGRVPLNVWPCHATFLRVWVVFGDILQEVRPRCFAFQSPIDSIYGRLLQAMSYLPSAFGHAVQKQLCHGREPQGHTEVDYRLESFHHGVEPLMVVPVG